MSDRDRFIRAIAALLTAGINIKLTLLRSGNLDALQWARAWQAAGLSGWATADEAEARIRTLLTPTPATSHE